MPLPVPRSGESKDDFVARFMSNATARSDFPDEQQRLAVALDKWQSRQMDKQTIQLKWNESIVEIASDSEKDFRIKGIAINATTTTNGHIFLGEELSKSANTLVGVPLLKDHENMIDNIVGKVINAVFNETNRNIQFEARIMDSKMQEMIRDGRIGSVSVGASVTDLEEGEDGNVIPRGIQFKELSLVAIPADQGATFSVALKEAFKMNEATVTDMEGERKRRGMTVAQFYAAPRDPPSASALPIFDASHTRNAMARFNQTKFKSAGEKSKARAKIITAAKKFGIDTKNFAEADQKSHKSYSFSSNEIKLKGGTNEMAEETETQVETPEEKKEEASEEESKEAEPEAQEEPKEDVAEEKIRKIFKEELSKLSVKSADKDEESTEAPKEEESKEESKEEKSEDEDEEESESTEESHKGYRLESSHGSLKGGAISLVRDKY